MKYDKKFKKEAMRKYLNGQSIGSVSRETGVSEAVLHKREHAMITKGSGEVDKEKLEMRKRIMELEMRMIS
jgi:hypothetical protein